jgi:dTDP-4-dehydrorhamnose 3,5-epimerase
MIFEPTELPEVVFIRPKVFGDARGFFMETWNAAGFAEAGLDPAFVQDNHSRSQRGVLRGIHYQIGQPQGKLVRVTSGRVFDVAVDLRRSSATLGHWVGRELSAENHAMLWIPPGFGHGFLALEDDTDFLYKCTAFYAPADERCIAWNDPDLAIAWPLNGELPAVSAKDAAGLPLGRAELYA